MISGPGGTLYGPNAVNGVISIATRDARETIGGLVRGTRRQPTSGRSARATASRSATTARSRFYGNAFDRDGLPDGARPRCRRPLSRLTGRASAPISGLGANTLTAAGRYVRQRDRTSWPATATAAAISPCRWHRAARRHARLCRFRPITTISAAASCCRATRSRRFDLEAQYNRPQGAHELVAGGGVRTTRDEFINNAERLRARSAEPAAVDPATASPRTGSRSRPSLSLTAGRQGRRSSFTRHRAAAESPARLASDAERTCSGRRSSRAVRTPSRIDRELDGPPFLAAATDFRSEKLIAFEAGYRGQPTAHDHAFGLASSSISTTTSAPPSSSATPLPVRLSNSLDGP